MKKYLALTTDMKTLQEIAAIFYSIDYISWRGNRKRTTEKV